MTPRLLTVDDLAAETREHPQTWRQRIRRREIPARRIGSTRNGKLLVSREDFEVWLANLPQVGRT